VLLTRKKIAVYGFGGAGALAFLALLTILAVYLSAGFVVRYARLSAEPASAGQHAEAARPSAR
jgi:hypothetical protein